MTDPQLDYPKVDKRGNIICDTPGSIQLYRLEVIASRLKLEAMGLNFGINTGPVAREILVTAGWKPVPRGKARLAEEFRKYLDKIKEQQLG